MKTRTPSRTALLLAILLLAFFTLPRLAEAHCDSLDGPVVRAARAALAGQEVDLVLPWVQPEHEEEIRDAFRRTLQVRTRSGEARELADLWFFETLVRVHRQGEGAPYTGLKPKGWKPPALVAAADRVLQDGQISLLADEVGEHVARELHTRYEQVMALEGYEPSDLEAGRRHVHAYVDYVHFLEALHHLLHGTVGHELHPHHEP